MVPGGVLSRNSIFGTKSENRVSEIQWLPSSKTLEKANLRQNPERCGIALARRAFGPARSLSVTTLLDAEAYCVSDLAELYRQRWQVKTSLAQLKTTMQMDVLHCKTVPGVLKELTIFAIVYNLVRLVMRQSATL